VVEDEPLLTARANAADLGGTVPVAPAVGAALRFLTAAIGARAVVEIGTGCGSSGIWLLRGMRPGAVLTSVDTEPEYHRLARKSFAQAGFATNQARLAHDELLGSIINAVTSTMPAADLVAALDEAGIACARLRTPAQFAAHPQLTARDRWRSVDSPAGPIPAMLPPLTLGGRAPVMGAIPALGQHTHKILAELGVSRT